MIEIQRIILYCLGYRRLKSPKKSKTNNIRLKLQLHQWPCSLGKQFITKTMSYLLIKSRKTHIKCKTKVNTMR